MEPIIKEYFMGSITSEQISAGIERAIETFGTDEYFAFDIWEKVRKLGYFPIRIKAVKEGTLVPEDNVVFTMESTEDWFAPMLSHFEDALMWNWYSSGVATRSFYLKKALKSVFEATSDVTEFVYPFSVNDFGLRGGVFEQGAIMGGMGHLISFDGTDNFPAIDGVLQYYGSKGIGKSVWATEHSVATSYGPGQGEYDYLEAQLDRAPSNAVISIVIDSYDADNFIDKVVRRFKDKIIARTGRTVFRPDSNDPLTNVCKYSEKLGDIFGFSLNSKGKRVINHNVGLIQGDGMNERSIPQIYKDYTSTGWAADNFITGSGGGLLVEGLTRDTQRWAVKASYAVIDGQEIDIRKLPKSDMTKASKCGKLKLHKAAGSFSTIESSKETPQQFAAYTDELEVVFENGELKREQSFEEIRQIANSYL
jgi:nicotinamide phosphoribosyltransferase